MVTPIGSPDFFDIKGLVEGMLEVCGITEYTLQKTDMPTFHPGRNAEVLLRKHVGRHLRRSTSREFSKITIFHIKRISLSLTMKRFSECCLYLPNVLSRFPSTRRLSATSLLFVDKNGVVKYADSISYIQPEGNG